MINIMREPETKFEYLAHLAGQLATKPRLSKAPVSNLPLDLTW